MKTLSWIFKQVRAWVPVCLLMLLINGAASLMNVSVALVSKRMVDHAISGQLQAAITAAVIFGAVIIARIVVSALASALSVKTAEELSNKIRETFFLKVMLARWQETCAYHSGDIATRLTSDAASIAQLAANIVPLAAALGVQLTASFLALFYYEPSLALLAFALGPITILLSRFWGRKLKAIQKKVQETESVYRSFLQESLQNLMVIKAFRQEEIFKNRLKNHHANRMAWIVKKNRTGIYAGSVLAVGYWTGYFLAFGWGALSLGKKSITFGTLTAFLQLVEQIQSPFMGLARTLPRIVTALASAERLMELESLSPEVLVEKVNLTPPIGIRMRDVSFAYKEDRAVLKDINLDIRPGELVAVAGPSGEGKTTLIKTLLALLEPEGGSIDFYSEDGRTFAVSRETRNYIAYVPQGNSLFSGTIRDNICLGLSDAAQEDILEACRAACVIDFVQTLDQGLDSVIGEKGVGLSEGQVQRVAIARALLRRSPVLILDEATSALDAKTEVKVLNGIKDLSPRPTCIVITHRPAAMKICSRILTIHDGRLREFQRVGRGEGGTDIKAIWKRIAQQ